MLGRFWDELVHSDEHIVELLDLILQAWSAHLDHYFTLVRVYFHSPVS